MKSFFSMFSDSARELKSIRCIVVTGLMIAVAILIRSFAIQITENIRISFAFLAIMVVAMLFGPVVAASANLMADFIGFLFDKTGNAYSPVLALVVVLAGLLYGMILYQKDLKSINAALFIRAAVARISVILICNICLNSYIIYVSFVNNNFSFSSESQMDAFKLWLSPRILKNVIQLPVDVLLICAVLPAVFVAYNQIFKKKISEI